MADVLDGPAYAAVEGTGVGGALERQAKLFVVDPPVVENGGDLVVHDVPLQDAFQHHLATHQHSVCEQWDNSPSPLHLPPPQGSHAIIR